MKALFSGGPGAGAGDFEQHLKSLLQDDPQAMAEFEKLTKEGPGKYHHIVTIFAVFQFRYQ